MTQERMKVFVSDLEEIDGVEEDVNEYLRENAHEKAEVQANVMGDKIVFTVILYG